jgi:hypothetical protein
MGHKQRKRETARLKSKQHLIDTMTWAGVGTVELAAHAGVAHQFISALRSTNRPEINGCRRTTALLIADRLDVPADELFFMPAIRETVAETRQHTTRRNTVNGTLHTAQVSP